MKIGIHKSPTGFSQDWIDYCVKHSIAYKVVDCYSNDIIQQVEDCQLLMWHHHHTNAKDILFAKELLFSLQQAGKSVFPDINSGWHFDDKLAQKYLLESINAPLAPTFVFYEKQQALNWVSTTQLPLVFKLRCGAGSNNVKLVRTKRKAYQIVNKSFGRGFPSYDRWNDLRENWRVFKWDTESIVVMVKSIRRLFLSTRYGRVAGRQSGYVLFQEFIPKNLCDIRVVVIGKKAFAIKRSVRKDDFRASGSGLIVYDRNEIDERCVQIAFKVTKGMNAQVVAFDFVIDCARGPLIVEVNFGYAHKAYFNCPGYWDETMKWTEAKFNSAHWILEVAMKAAESKMK